MEIWRGFPIEKAPHNHPKRKNSVYLRGEEDPPWLPLEDSTITPLKILSKEACTKEVSCCLARTRESIRSSYSIYGWLLFSETTRTNRRPLWEFFWVIFSNSPLLH